MKWMPWCVCLRVVCDELQWILILSIEMIWFRNGFKDNNYGTAFVREQPFYALLYFLIFFSYFEAVIYRFNKFLFCDLPLDQLQCSG